MMSHARMAVGSRLASYQLPGGGFGYLGLNTDSTAAVLFLSCVCGAGLDGDAFGDQLGVPSTRPRLILAVFRLICCSIYMVR